MSPLAGPPEAGYPPDSRYAGIARVTRTLRDGRVVAYLRRRIVPQPPTGSLDAEHEVRPFDRLDTMASQAYANSRLWWRIADANRAVDPNDLLVQGRRLVLPDTGGPDGGER
jgi:nucleoid-associated protein YgaU